MGQPQEVRATVTYFTDKEAETQSSIVSCEESPSKSRVGLAPAGVAELVGCRSTNRKVTISIPWQDTWLGCRYSPSQGAHRRQPTDVSLSHRCISSSPPSFPPLKSKVKVKLKKKVNLARNPAMADATASAVSPSHWDCFLGESQGLSRETPAAARPGPLAASNTAQNWEGHRSGS